MRRLSITSLLVIFGLLLASCGVGSSPIEKVEVSDDDIPEVTVKAGFEVDETETRVITAGNGGKIEDGDSIRVKYIALNGRTGEVFDNSFENDQTMTVTMTETGSLPGFYNGLLGQELGSRVVVAVPPVDGVEKLGALEALSLEVTDTLVFLFDLVSKVPTEASGEAQEAPAHLPSLELNDDEQPSGFKATDSSDKELAKTQSAVLIKGDGPEVEAGQVVTAHYIGQQYPGGDVFDESWSSAPRQFAVGAGQLIACWDDELVGQTIGSRVIVACTADDAYGDSAAETGAPEGALIFVVDLLDAI